MSDTVAVGRSAPDFTLPGTDGTAPPSDGTGMHFAMVSPAGLFDLATPSHPITGDDTWHHVAVTSTAPWPRVSFTRATSRYPH